MLDPLVFLDCPAWIQDEIRAYWAEKQPRLERLLSAFPPERCHLRVTVRQARGRWAARAALSIPTATLAARREAEDWSEALDGLADRLASEIRRHQARLRHDDIRFHQELHTAHGQTAS